MTPLFKGQLMLSSLKPMEEEINTVEPVFKFILKLPIVNYVYKHQRIQGGGARSPPPPGCPKLC